MSFLERLATEKMINLAYAGGLGDVDSLGRRAWVHTDLARQFMYADCDIQTSEAAIARLRPQAQSPYSVACSLDAYPDVPTTSIVCSDDQLVIPAWSREFAQTRLNAELVEMPGSHSPFLSRPDDLAAILDELA
jgi:pimeloyl-ACP methyl ester carboxylesterase